MPYDAHDKEIRVGDEVCIPGTIVAIEKSEDYCNVSVKLKYVMPKYVERTTISSLNTRQLEKIRDGQPTTTHPF